MSLTLTPGLIELHSHLLLHAYGEVVWDDQVLKEAPTYRVLRAGRDATRTLMSGFTTERDLGTEGAADADRLVLALHAPQGGHVPTACAQQQDPQQRDHTPRAPSWNIHRCARSRLRFDRPGFRAGGHGPGPGNLSLRPV